MAIFQYFDLEFRTLVLDIVYFDIIWILKLYVPFQVFVCLQPVLRYARMCVSCGLYVNCGGDMNSSVHC